MCGIAGVANVDGEDLGADAEGILRNLADILTHRGPDARNILQDGPVGMAFTRLSLVGPSNGDQPLISDDGSLVLVANGEVYNHHELATKFGFDSRLRTDSDCEALLYMYQKFGLDFLDDVRGMFALILWDRVNQQLVLARDRFGIKPLHYHRNGRRIVLGSEIKALFADPATPRELDWERALTTPLLTAAPYFSFEGINTWFKEIVAVPAATIIRVDLSDGATRSHKYWEFPGSPTGIESPEGLITEYRRLLTESVSDCATADAEIGLFLSGGIDSGIVAALAANKLPNLHTFTVLSASTYINEDAVYAHNLAGELGVANHQVLFDDQRVPDPSEWKRLLWLLETPFCGPEIYYRHELHRHAKEVRPELRAMLLGAASDEFNGGYTVNYSSGDGWSMFEQNIRSMARASALRARPDLSPWWSHGDVPLLTDAAIADFADHRLDDTYLDYLKWQYRNLQQYNVWHEDRTAAGSGIEARVPFLDHRLVELSTGLPWQLRERLLWDKRLLREAAKGILSDKFRERPKVPFFHGDAVHYTYDIFLRMIQREQGALIDESLAAPGVSQYVDVDAVRQTVVELAKNATGSPQVEILLRLVNLGLLSAMAHDIPPPTARTPVPVPPPAERVSHWDDQVPETERKLGISATVPDSVVPNIPENVLLLNAANDPGTWYVTIDGQIEFVLDGTDPEILQLFSLVDGEASVAELRDKIGCDADALSKQLRSLAGARVVSLP